MLCNRSSKFAFLVLVIASLPGCISSGGLAKMGTEYEAANKAAVDTVTTEANEVKRVRRIGAALAYINNPTLRANENLNNKEVPASFANFVCTGSDDFDKTRSGLEFTSQYAKTVKAITEAPNDSIAGYVDALRNLKDKDAPLESVAIESDIYNTCRRNIQASLPIKGFTAATARPESPLAALSAMTALIGAVQELLKQGLKVVTEEQQRGTLKQFIEKNRIIYGQVLTQDLSADELNKAFERRKSIALALPYFEFEDMMKLSTTTQRTEILTRAAKINADLAEYDAISTQKAPGLLTLQFSKINKKLDDYANGKISRDELIQYLSEVGGEIKSAKDAYDKVIQAGKGVSTAWGSNQ
ncbi:hypothetical protein [Cupriavidus sp. CuC1]|uniref:hypothetical protein n=1 Tax=Cupriavidus sp. CuC1 TaxID=3373131 RepID=UPI0037CFA734